MKRFLTLVLLLSLTLVSLSAQKALVIGNSGYASKALPQPARDAALIDSTLAQSGWTVINHQNLGPLALKTALSQFNNTLAEGEMAMVYFSGAVIQLDGLNYLVPVGIFKDAATFKTSAVELNWAISQLSKAGVKLIFLDGARSPANIGFKLAKPGMAALAKLPGNTILMYGSPLDTVLVDTSTSNSHFASAITQEIIKPDIEVNALPGKITEAMAILYGGKTPPQPWNASSVTDGWILNPSGENMPRYHFRGMLKMDVDGGGSYSF